MESVIVVFSFSPLFLSLPFSPPAPPGFVSFRSTPPPLLSSLFSSDTLPPLPRNPIAHRPRPQKEDSEAGNCAAREKRTAREKKEEKREREREASVKKNERGKRRKGRKKKKSFEKKKRKKENGAVGREKRDSICVGGITSAKGARVVVGWGGCLAVVVV